jgi:probable phosphoglycerate mutase
MRLKLYFLRHGQTALSRESMFCGRGTDPELTADGALMADQFAAGYQATKWAGIYCSPLKRARATVLPLLSAGKTQALYREELAEIDFGKWEGGTVADIDRKFHDDYVRWTADPAWNAPTDGETAIQIAGRARKLIEEIRGSITEGNVLLVSHKATIRIALCDLLGIEVARFRDRLSCPVGSVSVIEFGDRGPLLTKLADREHLDQRLRALPGT